LRVIQNTVLSIFGLKRDEVTRLKKLHNFLPNLKDDEMDKECSMHVKVENFGSETSRDETT
jgi:hypothetical protein